MSDSFDDAARHLPRHHLTEEEKRQQLHDLRDAIARDAAGTRPRGHRRRRLAIIACGVVCAAGVGVGTAAAFGAFSAPPTDRSVAYCFTTADLHDPTNHEDVTVALPPGQKKLTEHDAAASAIEICADAWKQGRYSATDPKITIPPKPLPWTYPVPPLVACILPSGQVAVFPGTEATCTTLGLPEAET